MLGKLFPAGMLILIFAGPGCSLRRPPAPVLPAFPHEIIAEIKEFQKKLGVRDTENFLRYSETPRAFYRCYFTGKLEPPISYERLQLIQSDST